jgi:methionine-rich copper-binding protein CopC
MEVAKSTRRKMETITASLRWSAAALLLAFATFALFTGSAEAHARYERSVPRDGAVVTESPGRVDVWFTQELARRGGLPTMVVVNESGDTIADEAVLDDDDRTHMYVELPPDLPDGRYTVIWHNLSDSDGDEARGAFHFFIDRAATPTPAEPTFTDTIVEGPVTPIVTEPQPTETPTPSPTVAPATGEGGNGVPVWVLVLGIVSATVLGGGVGLALGRRPGG